MRAVVRNPKLQKKQSFEYAWFSLEKNKNRDGNISGQQMVLQNWQGSHSMPHEPRIANQPHSHPRREAAFGVPLLGTLCGWLQGFQFEVQGPFAVDFFKSTEQHESKVICHLVKPNQALSTFSQFTYAAKRYTDFRFMRSDWFGLPGNQPRWLWSHWSAKVVRHDHTQLFITFWNCLGFGRNI